MYGWELTFKKRIEEIRENELANLERFAFRKSLERGLSNSIGFISSIVMFIIASSAGEGLTLAKIYSVLEIMSSLKMSSQQMIIGFGLYY